MKTTVRKLLAALAAMVALTGNTTGGSGARTDPQPDAAQEEPPQTAEPGLVFEREVYAYPAGGRRNPFAPAELGPDRGARIEGIILLGIIHHPDPLYRVAVMRLGGGNGGVGNGEESPVATAASRLRIGGVFAGARIVAIEADHVVVEVEEPGGTVPGVLAMPRTVRGRES